MRIPVWALVFGLICVFGSACGALPAAPPEPEYEVSSAPVEPPEGAGSASDEPPETADSASAEPPETADSASAEPPETAGSASAEPFPHPGYSTTGPAALGTYDRDACIRVGSLNTGILGGTKQSRTHTFGVLASVVTNFDILALQEVGNNSSIVFSANSDKNAASVMNAYIARVNALADGHPSLGPYAYVRAHQYAYVYRVNAVTISGEQWLSDRMDTFTYAPHAAKFTSAAAPGFSFVLVNIHTSPGKAKTEIPAISRLMNDMAAHYGEEKVSCLGDYNADSAGTNYYVSGSAAQGWLNGFSPPDWFTVIPNGTDTTVAAQVNAYDRIQLSSSLARYSTGTWGVIRWAEYTDVTLCEGTGTPGGSGTFGTERALSDHFPVWAEFRLPE